MYPDSLAPVPGNYIAESEASSAMLDAGVRPSKKGSSLDELQSVAPTKRGRFVEKGNSTPFMAICAMHFTGGPHMTGISFT